jgi:hypothetical protein
MIGEGVHNVYKERAKKGGDILWHVTIKGQKELTEGIPLHMSLKVFEDKNEMDIENLKSKVKEFKIKTPDPKKLRFKTTIFTSEKDGKKYYMLIVSGTDKAYEDFYDSLRHCGTVYKKFMMHITIDKGLYDKINEEGLKPKEIQFMPLSIEYGAGNAVYEFKKSLDCMDIATIRQTILLNIDLNHNHPIAAGLSDETLKNYVEDKPELNEQILKKHEARVAFHFNVEELKRFAMENGIAKTYDILRKK